MNSIKTTIIAASAAIAMQAAPTLAQNSGTIETFTRADLYEALTANEATYEPSEDNRTINVTFKNELRANAAVMACDDDDEEINCYATSILSTFGKPDGLSIEDVETAVTTYNYRENFGRAYVDPESGRISVRIYIISDGGITRENYRRQIELWATSLSYFVEYLYERTEDDGATA